MRKRITPLMAAALWLAVAVTPAPAHSQAPALRSSPLQVDPADGFVYVVNPDSDTVTRLTPLSGN